MEEIVIIFVEGHGENIFFKKLIEEIKVVLKKQIKPYEIENMKSIGRFKNKALRIYKNRYKDKYKCKKIVLFNYDSDVFKEKPYPVDWKEIEKKFKESDKNCTVDYLKVEENLEDLLLLDIKGIMKFLKIKKSDNELKILFGSLERGSDKIKLLFREGSRIYTKNERELEELLEHFDMKKIINADLHCINVLIEKITY